MSTRTITLILPVHNIQTMRVLLAIIASEGETDNPSTSSSYVTMMGGMIEKGFETRRGAEGYDNVIQTSNLHVTISGDCVKYKGGRYTWQTMRVQISSYSCDPYGREAIAKIVEQSATRY